MTVKDVAGKPKRYKLRPPNFRFAVVNGVPLSRQGKGRPATKKREAFIQYAQQVLEPGLTLVYVHDVDESDIATERLFGRRFDKTKFQINRRGTDLYVTKLAPVEPFDRRQIKE